MSYNSGRRRPDYGYSNNSHQNMDNQYMNPPCMNNNCEEMMIPDYKSHNPQGYMHKPLAMAYVPWQKFENLYDMKEAFACGTIFKQLNFPFKGCSSGRSGR